jgi:hypothetical protein
MENIVPLWTKQQLEDLVHTLAQDSLRVIFREHCLERLAERGVTATEALRCLRRGSITKGPAYSQKHNNFEFRMSELPPRDVVCMVVAVNPITEPGEVFAITVWEL